MFFMCIMSLLSWYTMQINKPALVDIKPTMEINSVNTYNKKISNHKNLSLWSEKTDNQDTENQDNILQWDSSEDFSNEEIYEEIIFHDDFDKEYWNDVDSNYQDE